MLSTGRVVSIRWGALGTITTMSDDRNKDIDESYVAAPGVTRLRKLEQLSGAALRTVALDRSEDADVRCTALRQFRKRKQPEAARIDLALEVAADRAAPAQLRAEAIRQAALLTFHPALMESRRPRYLAVLRDAAQAADPALRLLTLEKLAVEKDVWAMDELRKGIDSPAEALVPLSQAVGLLSYDVKAESFPTLHRIVDESDDDDAREQALRVLAADGGAAGKMERIATDKKQAVRVRRAAAGLRSLDEGRLRAVAKKIALDESDDTEMRGASFTALSTLDGDDDHEVLTRATELSQQKPGTRKKALTLGAKSYVRRRT